MTALLTITDGKIVSDEPWRGAEAEGRLIDWSGKWVLPGPDRPPHPCRRRLRPDRRSRRAAEAQRGGDDPQGRRNGAHHAACRLHDRPRRRRLSRPDRRRACATRSPPARSKGRGCSSPAATSPFPAAAGLSPAPSRERSSARNSASARCAVAEEARERVRAMIGGGADFIKLIAHRRGAGDRQRAGRARADARK